MSTFAACRPSSTRRPQKIAGALDAKLTELPGGYDRVFVAYADCGTGGALDIVLNQHDVEKLPGAHCYGFLAGNDAWDAMQEEEPGTFYLTDFLAPALRGADRAAVQARYSSRAGADDVRQLPRLVFLAQTDNPDLLAGPRPPRLLGLRFEKRRTATASSSRRSSSSSTCGSGRRCLS